MSANSRSSPPSRPPAVGHLQEPGFPRWTWGEGAWARGCSVCDCLARRSSSRRAYPGPGGAMNDHLAEIARTVAPGAHAALVLDGAGWHGGHALVVPDNISLVVLPPYSPELNPRTSGITCAQTGSPSASSTTTQPSSRPAAERGTASPTSPTSSPQSLRGNGQRSMRRAVGISRRALRGPAATPRSGQIAPNR